MRTVAMARGASNILLTIRYIKQSHEVANFFDEDHNVGRRTSVALI